MRRNGEAAAASEVACDAVRAAESRIRGEVRHTPLEHSAYFSELTGAEVHFKLESLQHTGSFKARGALSKVLWLDDAARREGVVSASSGNHGAAVAFSLSRTGSEGIVFVPENASSAKVANIRRYGAEVRFHGTDAGDTEAYARRYAAEHGLTFVSPYNDLEVVGGQGTIAVELREDLPHVDAVFASIGGGGLIGGIGAFLAVESPDTRIFGVSPQNSQVMIQSVRANRILALPSAPTISDGTAGGVEADALTFDLVRDHVDELMTVSEEEIKHAMTCFIDNEHQLLEGAAGTAVAGLCKQGRALQGLTVVVVVCGANISVETLRSVLAP